MTNNSDNVRNFFKELFGAYFEERQGFIETREINQGPPRCLYHSSIEELLEVIPNLTGNVFFGVTPRQIKDGKKTAVKYCTVLWVDVDYGIEGHKKKCLFATRAEAVAAINSFSIRPSLIVESGNGFHVYWLLKRPVEVSNPVQIENINRALCYALAGDPGTHDLSRVLRVPGTHNVKDPTNPKPVSVVLHKPERRYDLSEFKELVIYTPEHSKVITVTNEIEHTGFSKRLKALPEDIQTHITAGHSPTDPYESRSEVDYKVVHSMIAVGFQDPEIISIFNHYPIGAKHHEQPKHYLKHTIKKARKTHKFGKRSSSKIIAVSILSAHKIITSGSRFYIYKDGYYKEHPDEIVKKLILENVDDTVTTHKLNDICNMLKVISYVSEDKLNQEDVLNVKNGLFDLDSMKLNPHSPDVFSTVQLNVAYSKEAKASKWLKSLDEIFQGKVEYIALLQEYFGLCLTSETKFEKALFLLGEGANGKSVVLHILSQLLGSESYSAIPLEKFADMHYTANLFGKLANISIETYVKADVYDSTFKAIVSGDEIQADHKYMKPFKFKPFCKLIFALNNMPRVSDKSSAFFRRLIILLFEKQFSEKEQNKNLKHELERELDGIFLWALAGWQRLKERGSFDIPESLEKHISQYRDENNNVLVFVKEGCQMSPEMSTTKDKLYQRYRWWCEESGYKPLSKLKFGKEIKRQFTAIQDGKNSAGDRTWIGIDLIVTNGEKAFAV